MEKQLDRQGRSPYSLAEGLKLIREQIQKGENFLKNRPIDDAIYSEWMSTTLQSMHQVFGPGTDYASAFLQAGSVSPFLGASQSDYDDRIAAHLRSQLVLLNYGVVRFEALANLK